MQAYSDSAGDPRSTFADESWKPSNDEVVVLAQADESAALEFANLVRPLLADGTEIKGNRINKFMRVHPDLAQPLEQLFARCEISVHDLGIYKAEIRGTLLVCARRSLLLPPAYVNMLEATLAEPLASWTAFADSICQSLSAQLRPWSTSAPAVDPRVRRGHSHAIMLARSNAALIDAVRPEVKAAVEASLSDARFVMPARPAAELALHGLRPDRWFDQGNALSIESIRDQRTALHALALDVGAGPWDARPGAVRETDSLASRGVQLADLVAWRALRDYRQHGLAALTDRHPLVVCNGRRACAA